MQGVEKVVFVCKLLLDQRVIELKRENEQLKLKLFWKTYNPTHLKGWMAEGNQCSLGPKCGWLVCCVSGRASDEEVANRGTFTCTFKPWFEQKITECGMTIGCGTDGVTDGSHVDDYNSLYDVDCHFNSLARQDWLCWSYGSKLWKATSVNDPELKKLAALFKVLDLDDDDSNESS
jgi:hypothetical protein